jgi:hypothetical protein
MQFKVFSDGDSDKVLISTKPMTDSDHPVWFVIRIMYTEEWDSEWAAKNGKYNVEIHAAGHEWAERKELESAARSIGMEMEQFDGLAPDVKAVLLMEYGISACLWQRSGNNVNQLVKAAKHNIWPDNRSKNRETKIIGSIMFGFTMDQPLNMIGSTGWDFIRGDILAGLKKHEEAVS